jgi:FimV-like protein
MKKTLFLSLLLSTFLVSSTFETGKDHFSKNQFNEAYQIFQQLSDNGDITNGLDFYLGRSALEIGKFKEALFAFERILIEAEDEATINRTKLELARTHIGLGEVESAKALLKEVLKSNPPAKIKTNVSTLLSSLENQKIEEKFVSSIFVKIMAGYEENVNSQADIEDLRSFQQDPNLVSDMVDSEYFGGMASVYSAYNFSNNFALQGVVFGYLQDYSENGDEFDISTVSLQVSPIFKSGYYKFEFPMRFNTVNYGGEELLSSFSYGAKVSESIIKDVIFSLFANFKAKDMKNDNNATGDSHSTQLGFSGSWKGKSNQVNFRYYTEIESSDDDMAPKVNLTDKTIHVVQTKFNQKNLVAGIDVSLSHTLRKTSYDDYEAFKSQGVPDGNLKVTQNNFGIEVKKEILKDIVFSLSANRIINHTNYLPFEYDKNMYNFGLEYSY